MYRQIRFSKREVDQEIWLNEGGFAFQIFVQQSPENL